jgi:tyrosyl-tRNA synthetase
MELKKTLGRELVTQLYDAATAIEAEANFVRTVQHKELPDDIPEVKIAFNPTPDGSCDIARIITAAGQCQSMGQAKRLIDQGGVSIDGEKLSGKFAPLATGAIIKVGKRNVVKIINSDE